MVWLPLTRIDRHPGGRARIRIGLHRRWPPLLLQAIRADFDLGSVLLHPSYVAVHPALQELLACRANAAVRLEKAFLGLDKRFGLAKRRHVEIGQDVAKMLLRG